MDKKEVTPLYTIDENQQQQQQQQEHSQRSKIKKMEKKKKKKNAFHRFSFSKKYKTSTTLHHHHHHNNTNNNTNTTNARRTTSFSSYLYRSIRRRNVRRLITASSSTASSTVTAPGTSCKTFDYDELDLQTNASISPHTHQQQDDHDSKQQQQDEEEEEEEERYESIVAPPSNPTIRIISLLYNEGVRHVNRCRYEAALRCFDNASSILAPSYNPPFLPFAFKKEEEYCSPTITTWMIQIKYQIVKSCFALHRFSSPLLLDARLQQQMNDELSCSLSSLHSSSNNSTLTFEKNKDDPSSMASSSLDTETTKPVVVTNDDKHSISFQDRAIITLQDIALFLPFVSLSPPPSSSSQSMSLSASTTATTTTTRASQRHRRRSSSIHEVHHLEHESYIIQDVISTLHEWAVQRDEVFAQKVVKLLPGEEKKEKDDSHSKPTVSFEPPPLLLPEHTENSPPREDVVSTTTPPPSSPSQEQQEIKEKVTQKDVETFKREAILYYRAAIHVSTNTLPLSITSCDNEEKHEDIDANGEEEQQIVSMQQQPSIKLNLDQDRLKILAVMVARLYYDLAVSILHCPDHISIDESITTTAAAAVKEVENKKLNDEGEKTLTPPLTKKTTKSTDKRKSDGHKEEECIQYLHKSLALQRRYGTVFTFINHLENQRREQQKQDVLVASKIEDEEGEEDATYPAVKYTDSYMLIQTLDLLCILHIQCNNVDKAIACHKEYVSVLQSLRHYEYSCNNNEDEGHAKITDADDQEELDGEQRLVRVLSMLAKLYASQKEYTEAVSTLEQALSAIGSDDIFTTTTITKAAAEKQQQQQTLPTIVSMKQKNKLRISLLRHASEYHLKLHDYRSCLSMKENILALQRQVYGRYHSNVAITLHNMSRVYMMIGHYDEAVSCREEEVKIWKVIVEMFLQLEVEMAGSNDNSKGEDRACCKARSKLGVSSLREAREALQRVLLDLGSLYEDEMSEFCKAVECYEEALTLQITMLHMLNHPDYSKCETMTPLERERERSELTTKIRDTRRKIGGVYYKKGEFSMALMISLSEDTTTGMLGNNKRK